MHAGELVIKVEFLLPGMKLSFHGGTREVSGSCFLLESGDTRVLIDCGLFQGCEECPELNFKEFAFDPRSLDAVLVTHAHLDHVGRIPRLVEKGFSGKIFSTAPTRDLAVIILEDALHLAQRETRHETHGELFLQEDLDRAVSQWQNVSYYERVQVGGLEFKFHNAGHILGSASIECIAEGRRLLFSGDVGNVPSTMLPRPDFIHDIEYLVLESTYGNRVHESEEERTLKLERTLEDVASRRGTLLIPAFATERTQEILFLLNEMLLERRIPEMPIFVDSPLAIRATEVFERYANYYNESVQKVFRVHPSIFQSKKLKFTETVDESKGINDVPPPKVIIAGSGMMTGGRILHHLRRYLGDEKSILLVVGYQSAGSLGRRLIDGEKFVKIFGDEIQVAAEVRKINGFSAHADRPELYAFAEASKDSLKHVFLVHGEEAAALHITQEIRDRMGVPAVAPVFGEEFTL